MGGCFDCKAPTRHLRDQSVTPLRVLALGVMVLALVGVDVRRMRRRADEGGQFW